MRRFSCCFKVDENFPATKGEIWLVRERGKIVEEWEITQGNSSKSCCFWARITEYIPGDKS